VIAVVLASCFRDCLLVGSLSRRQNSTSICGTASSQDFCKPHGGDLHGRSFRRDLAGLADVSGMPCVESHHAVFCSRRNMYAAVMRLPNRVRQSNTPLRR